ncbi:MAG TPA: tRNA dihydrouridine synthase DusB [Gammaproteobacteria bacterium]|nr:tRNA dihydrouridine synthase DusB [Gammaproteobacteria bacterium]
MKPLSIGPCTLANNLLLAPMAGVTDLPFRNLCRRLGAGMAISEMVASNPRVRGSTKSEQRLNHAEELSPVVVQILGNDPLEMAAAARLNVERGAEIIDINMGCPAKKVCRKAAGSALLADEHQVARILRAVVNAVDVPVTLKIRTGIDPDNRNALTISRIAEESGIQLLSIHGRTRSDKFLGEAEFETIASVVSQVSIPVIANGDIRDPVKAREVLEFTAADGVMIGRAAQGNPWIFREISAYLQHGGKAAAPTAEEKQEVLLGHLKSLYSFYGAVQGVRIARKHIGWYLATLPGGRTLAQQVNRIEDTQQQFETVAGFLVQANG